MEYNNPELRTMPKKKYIVALSAEERENLELLTKKGKITVYKLNHAHILLKADINQEGGSWKDSDISEAFNISVSTIERVRKSFVEESLEAALSRQTPIRTKPRLLDGDQEAHLIALACSSTPEGQGTWTMRLLAKHMVELNYVETISHETVRQTLKKTSLSLG
jgi:transposase